MILNVTHVIQCVLIAITQTTAWISWLCWHQEDQTVPRSIHGVTERFHAYDGSRGEAGSGDWAARRADRIVNPGLADGVVGSIQARWRQLGASRPSRSEHTGGVYVGV